MGDEDIFETPVKHVDENFPGKEVLVLCFDPPKYNPKENWQTISRADKVTVPLRADFREHENELIEPLESNNYQYGIGLMTFANLVSGHCGAVDVDNMLEQRRTNLFLKKVFTLAIVDGRRSGSCI